MGNPRGRGNRSAEPGNVDLSAVDDRPSADSADVADQQTPVPGMAELDEVQAELDEQLRDKARHVVDADPAGLTDQHRAVSGPAVDSDVAPDAGGG